MKKKIKLVEIARSFSMKKNLGNYESVDFFCSEKAEVPKKDAKKTSEALYQFCKAECVKSYNDFLKAKTPEEEYILPVFKGTKEALERLTIRPKEFVKPWQKQMRDSMAHAQAEFGEEARKTIEREKGRPVYTMTENGKELVDKEAGNQEPY